MSIPLDLVLLYDIEMVDAVRNKTTGLSLTVQNDEALVALTCGGNVEAFEELVRRYRNEVFALAFHFVRNREEAWDVSQEVFIKAHKALARFRGDCGFKTWLMRITSNQCKDLFKKRRLRTVSLDAATGVRQARSGDIGPGKALEAREIGEGILAALEMLPAKHRLAFVLREFEGLSYEEMARVMACNIGTVMSRLHHARHKLQHMLIQMGVVEEGYHG